MNKLIFTPFSHKEIKNIIFDLGGVILNIDYNLTIEAFKKLGIVDFEEIFSQASQAKVFDKIDKGQIFPAEFRDEIRKYSGLKLSDKQIDDAWNAMILDFPAIRINLLEQLSKQYKIFLLSNTNAIHIEAYNKILKDSFGLDNLSYFFQKEYYSHLINMRKPEPEVFEYILNENAIRSNETLFIDDSIQHIESAKKLGIFAYHLDLSKGESIENLFATR